MPLRNVGAGHSKIRITDMIQLFGRDSTGLDQIFIVARENGREDRLRQPEAKKTRKHYGLFSEFFRNGLNEYGP